MDLEKGSFSIGVGDMLSIVKNASNEQSKVLNWLVFEVNSLREVVNLKNGEMTMKKRQEYWKK